MSLNEKLILVGRFGAPHGLRGQIRVTSFTQNPEQLFSYPQLFGADGITEYRVVKARASGPALFIVSLEGFTRRMQVEPLVHQDLFILRDALPAIEDEEEFYQADLIGLEVFTQDNVCIGKVHHILNHGAGDILEIDLKQSDETLLLAFTKDFVPVVDVLGGRIVVKLPEETE